MPARTIVLFGKVFKMGIFIDGLSLGAIYALIALGYTMVYGIAKMLNFAHGDVIMVGAYTVFATLALDGSVYMKIAAVVVAVVVCTVLGVVVERLAYRPLRGASPLAVLITAIGVSYLLQSISQLVFGADTKQVLLGINGNFKLGNTIIAHSTVITLIAASAVMIALTLFVSKTRTGRAMVAVSEDKGAAQLMGVNVNKIIALTFAIGSSLAAVAGVFYLMRIPAVSPTFGSMPGIKAFTAAVIGGIGSMPGAMIGGILLGVIEALCSGYEPIASYTTAIEFSLLILILLVRPTGLLGKKRREKV